MSAKSIIKEQIKDRSRWTFLSIAIIAILIFIKIIYLQTSKRKELLSKVAEIQRRERTIKATRGNIFASDGKSLLATSVPKYRVGIDPKQAKITLYDKHIDSLCLRLSNYFGDMSAKEYKELITTTRNRSKARFLPLGGRLVDHQEKLIIEKFPLFREGSLKGGGKFEKIENRFMPFNNMAMRTIGKLDRETNSKGEFGIEASFDNYLSGKDGKGFYERIAGGVWKPIDTETDVDSEPGLDVISTIDVNFQDIVENALRKQVFATSAKYGSAVVMEVATGEIKAMANLSRKELPDGEVVYIEDLNYAVKEGTDPGSTFKLASMIALIEKANLSENTHAVDCTGKIIHNGLDFTCSHAHGPLTVKEVFEQSCNVGIYELMKRYFGFSNGDDYIEYLKQFRLDRPTGFQLKGEPSPLIKSKKSSTFSNTTIPWMSIGYESRMTPLQMLSFYNTVANDGYWVQPIIVKETRMADKVIEKFEANRAENAICTDRSIKMVRRMMKGVVENGTAKNVNVGICKIAGKTGTSQKRSDGIYKAGKYYTSFIGYFPADQPTYSCIVVIDEPQGSNVYGGDVSAPVFRQIADKIFAYDVNIHPKMLVKSDVQKITKYAAVGEADDQRSIAEGFKFTQAPSQTGLIKPVRKNGSVKWEQVSQKGELSAVIGMTLKDALPLLENRGYRVRHTGIGKVKEYAVVSRNTISLTLN